jgi:tetratricopeptide (TPR) repeat protein
MITAENTREMVMGAIEYEPDSYLSKPFTKDLLRNRLEKLLAKKLDLEPIERAVELRNYAGAVQLLDQRIAKRPKNLAELTRLKAELCVKSGALDKAAAIYERILAVREIPWARLGSGQILFERRQFAEAREVFQDLINRNPDYVVAYDWLARAHDALQDPLAAQEILDHAVALSPKAVLRQQALGDLAMRNKDHVAAERAYVYAKLVEAQLSNDEHKDKKTSLAVVQQMEREFGRDSEAQLYTAMSEAAVQQSLGNDELARQQMEKAAQLYDRMGVHGKPQLTLALAKTAARVGDREQAEQLFQKAVRNNHEDDAFLRDAAAAAVDFGLEEDPGALIESIKKEIVDLNNRGVKLAGSGKLEQAIGLFEEAAEGMSGNRVINLNAAKVLIMLMERKGVDADTLGKARRYLERTRKLDPENTALAKVQEKFQKLINGHTL